MWVLLLLLLLNPLISLRIIIVEPGGPRPVAKVVCFCVYGNMMSPVYKENEYVASVVFCCCDLFFWFPYKVFHQKSDMTRHAIFGLILTFIVKTNEKPIKMRPGSEPCSQLESSILILVQGFSSTIRYDPSSHFGSYFDFYNENQWKINKNDARQRAKQSAWALSSDSRTRFFINNKIWSVFSCFVLLASY